MKSYVLKPVSALPTAKCTVIHQITPFQLYYGKLTLDNCLIEHVDFVDSFDFGLIGGEVFVKFRFLKIRFKNVLISLRIWLHCRSDNKQNPAQILLYNENLQVQILSQFSGQKNRHYQIAFYETIQGKVSQTFIILSYRCNALYSAILFGLYTQVCDTQS